MGNIQTELERNTAAARSASTRRGYNNAWSAFETFAFKHGSPALPASPSIVGLYLSAVGAKSAPATVGSHAAAISAHHRDANLPSPCRDPSVRKVILGHSHRRGVAQKQARPLDAEAAQRVIAIAVLPRVGRGGRKETPPHAADRAAIDIALIRTMRDGMLRRAEASALVWNDIEHAPDGSGRITVRRSKTDQAGEGKVLYLAPATMDALRLLDHAWIIGGVRVFRLSPSQICRRIAAAARAAGLGEGFSGHSPRIGMAIDLTRDGADLPALMEAGRWESPRMPARYTRNEIAGRNAVARFYGGKT